MELVELEKDANSSRMFSMKQELADRQKEFSK
jgi:hypothetical protein